MPKKITEQPDFETLQTQVAELTIDLQRTRADFENYRKRVDSEKSQARDNGTAAAILKLLPVVDNIERAIKYVPEELKTNAWVQSMTSLVKSLDKSLDSLNLKRIVAEPGTEFDPELHEAVMFDESDGDHEVIAEELQAGYTLNGQPIRHAMVKVTKK